MSRTERMEILETAAHDVCHLLSLLHTLHLNGMNWRHQIDMLRETRDIISGACEEIEREIAMEADDA